MHSEKSNGSCGDIDGGTNGTSFAYLKQEETSRFVTALKHA